MKFGKEFKSQMVQEWQEAYINYNNLKTILKEISTLRKLNDTPSPMATNSKGRVKRKKSLYRAFSGLTSRRKNNINNNDEYEKDEVILISTIQNDDQELSKGLSTNNQTMVFISSEYQDGYNEQLFFKKLDFEFNKVVMFYRTKVDDVLKEAEELNKQMDVLIALRIKVDDPLVGNSTSSVSSSALSFVPSGRITANVSLNSIQEVEMTTDDENKEEENMGIRENKISRIDNMRKSTTNGQEEKTPMFSRPASTQVLNHVKINVSPESQISSLKGMMSLLETNLRFSKKELKKAEDLMTKAFVEFYQRLRVLKSYNDLNLLALSKIMKKYDKITSRNASKTYLKMVDNSYLGNCDEVATLIKRVEATFIKHFNNGNRRKAMDTLRPKTKIQRHSISFLLGILFGCSIALAVAIGLIIRVRDILNKDGRNQYMNTIFPLYSLFGFIVLHMIMYALNIYFWRRYRINFSFIFGFKKGTELGYRDVFLLSSGLLVLTFAGILSNLDMEMDPRTQNFEAFTELVPLGLVIVVLMVTLCPLNVIYRSSRFFFVTSLVHSFLAPLYKVTLPDFFIADQLTSQVQAFRNIQFYVCYYGWGDFKNRKSCPSSDVFDVFYYIVAVVPYWLRCLQCLRRLFEEKHKRHGFNALKYMSTIVAVVMRTSFERQNRLSVTWRIMAATSSGVATIYNTYWDIVMDWGLLQKNSKNPWLRDKLLISNKSVYLIAMVLNVLLRLAWMQLVLGITEAPFLHRNALISLVACLEIIRRGIWNFFRLENEHLNNVGQYRAFKSVPLPFNFDDNEDKEI